MKKHRILAAALACLLAASLAGCAKDTKSIEIGVSSQPTTAATVPDDDTSGSSSTETGSTEQPKPMESEQQKEEKEEPATLETSEPTQPTIPSQENTTKPESTPAQTQKPKPSAPPKTEEPEPTAPPAPTEPPREPEPSAPPAVTEPPKGFTQADHERIVSEVTAYAESYRAKGFTFEWMESMEFGWDVGYMGTPRISRDGVEGTIRTLKYHVDLIVSTSTDPANGVTTAYMTYKVVQIEIDGGIAYAVIYGG